MRERTSLSADYFEGMFRNNPDPWSFHTSAYEREKFDATLHALGDRHYARGFEIGCANGALTRRLASRCDQLYAIDISNTAVALARQYCAGINALTIERMMFPAQCPDGLFDLIVLSEVVYYWSDADIARAAASFRQTWAGGGDMILVHWSGATDYPQTATAATEKLFRHLADSCNVLREVNAPKYRLDLWRRR